MNVAILGAGAIAFGSAGMIEAGGHRAALWSPSGRGTAALARGTALDYAGVLTGEAHPAVITGLAQIGEFDVVLIAIPIVIAILLITLIGIPLAVVLTAAYVIALVLSGAFVSYRIGLWVFDRLHRTGVSRWSAMIVGALLVSLGVSLPMVGWLVALAVVLTGAGALAVDWSDRRLRMQPG